MSDDIVKRLVRFDGRKCVSPDIEVEAAAEIEKLRKENTELLATCQGWANTVSDFTRKRDEAQERADAAIEALRVAREALEPITGYWIETLKFVDDEEEVECHPTFAQLKRANNALTAIDAVLKQGESE